MIDRPYRSGAQQRCMLKRQPTKVQEKVLEMVEDNTYNEILIWLGQQGITATWGQVRYFANRFGTKRKKYTIQPKETYLERLHAYIHELLKYQSETYTIHTLHMKGSSWTTVTARLHKAGLIQPLRQYTPIQWRITGSKDEIMMWRDAEIQRINAKELTPSTGDHD